MSSTQVIDFTSLTAGESLSCSLFEVTHNPCRIFNSLGVADISKAF